LRFCFLFFCVKEACLSSPFFFLNPWGNSPAIPLWKFSPLTFSPPLKFVFHQERQPPLFPFCMILWDLSLFPISFGFFFPLRLGPAVSVHLGLFSVKHPERASRPFPDLLTNRSLPAVFSLVCPTFTWVWSRLCLSASGGIF